MANTALVSVGESQGAKFIMVDGGFVGTGHDIQYIELVFKPATAGAVLTEIDLEFPEDARIETGHFEIAADPGDPAVISTVATIREAPPVSSRAHGAAIVDFGRLVTTGGLVSTGLLKISVIGGVSINAAYRWTGTSWSFLSAGASFAEVATERLLFESPDSSSAAIVDYLTNGPDGVSLPQTPIGLELLIDGTTVWFERQGSSPITFAGPAPAHQVAYAVDRTAALRDAVSRAVVTSAKKKVRVGLRATTPGLLTLTPHVGALRVHTHVFVPNGLQQAFDLNEEGQIDIDVTPPNAKDIREVAMSVRGSFGPERIQPPVGPALSGLASLALTPGRPLLIGLPATSTSRFDKLTGVRLHLTAGGTSGCEVTGRLLSSVLQRPGEPIAGGDLAAVTLNNSDSGWQTLALKAAIAAPTDTAATEAHDAQPTTVPAPLVAAWLEVQLGYGEAVCAMTSSPPTDLVTPGAPVVRRLPGGGTKGLTTISALGPLFAATRIVGLPDKDRPIAAVTLSVFSPSATTQSPDSIGVNPVNDPVQTLLTLGEPLTVTGPIFLRRTNAAVGSLVLDTIKVTYQEDAPS